MSPADGLAPATRAALVRDLERDEGVVPHPYKCSAGKWSIGAGRNFEDNRFTVEEMVMLNKRRAIGRSLAEQVTALKAVPLNRDEIQHLLDNDIAAVCRHADAIFGERWRNWSGGRQRAVLNMLFNLGPNRFKGFRNSIRLMMREEWEAVAANVLKSLWARQVGKRSERIASLFRRG
jgi:lysozyme